MNKNIFLFLFLFLLPYSSAVLINNPKIPLVNTEPITSTSGVSSYLDLDFTGTTGLSDGIDNTGGTPSWDSITGIPQLCYQNGTGCTDTDTFVANYSTFLTHATTTYVNTQNTSMKNYVDSQDSSYNTSNNNYILANNQSVVNWANSIFYLATNPSNYITSSALSPYLLISNWNSTNTSYATKNELNNGSYLNPDLSSYATKTELNNGSYLNSDLNVSTNKSFNNASLFLDANTNRVGINTYTPTERLDVSNGAIKVGYITDTFDQLVMFMRNNVLIGAIDNNAGDVRLKALNNNKVQIVDDSNNGISVNDGGEIILSNLTSANCDVKSWTNGSIYCGTDATGTGSGATWAEVMNGTIAQNNNTFNNDALRVENYNVFRPTRNWINYTTSDWNLSGSNTNRIISDMNVTLLASSTYFVTCDIFYVTPAATTGITWNTSFSTGVTTANFVSSSGSSATAMEQKPSITTGYIGVNHTGSTGVVTLTNMRLKGYIVTAAAPTLVHQFKSELAAPQYTQVKVGSSCEYKKVA